MTSVTVSIESEITSENLLLSEDETDEIKLNLSDTNNDVSPPSEERSVFYFFVSLFLSFNLFTFIYASI